MALKRPLNLAREQPEQRMLLVALLWIEVGWFFLVFQGYIGVDRGLKVYMEMYRVEC